MCRAIPRRSTQPRRRVTTAREAKNPTAEASMFYVAYFKNGGGSRPVTFIYNGGPGSATVWLHMGAFGPRRIVTATDAHTPAAPYSLINNASSLLDASDLVFIDAPGTGFSRIAGKDKEKAFYRCRSGCLCFRSVHFAVSHQVRALEFAQVSVRRELWNAALGRAHQSARIGPRH